MDERVETSDDVPLPGKPLTIGLVFNCKHGNREDDKEAEYDSMDTVQAIADAIASGGYQVKLMEADENLAENLRREKIGLAFNIAEGKQGRGREAEAPAVFNLLGIPFIGSDETALCVAMDKAMCKRLLSTYGIHTPDGAVCSTKEDIQYLNLRYPLIIKPNAEGSSKGIPDACIAVNQNELSILLESEWKHYGGSALVEEYIAGREFTVGILGNGKTAFAFPPMEIAFRPGVCKQYHVYSYTLKQDYKKYIDYLCPAAISQEIDRDMRAAAITAFRALGCSDFARVDFRMDEQETLYFIEINPLPGLAPGYSDYPMLAAFSGVGYRELVLSVLHAGITRLGLEGGW